MTGGFSRVLFSRTFSLFYIIIFARIVAKGIMDQMIILAAGHLIITQIAIFSMNYVCQQKALSASNELQSKKIQYNSVLLLLVISTPLSVMLSLPVIYYVTGTKNLELYLTYPLSFLLFMIKYTEVIFARSSLNVDRAIFLNTMYSILNSVLVPLFYFITPTLESVLWAWNVALFITVIWGIKPLLQVIKLKLFDWRVMQELLRFGFPIYIVSLPRPVTLNMNNLIIYETLEEGATSVFYWPNRILAIASEILSIVLTGTQELFTHIKVISKEKLRDSFLAVFRFLVVSATVFYFLIYLNASILINLLLGSGYLEAIYLFRLLCFSWIITTVNTVLSSLKNAEAHRRVMVKVEFLHFISKIILLVILIQFGLLGVVLAEIVNVTLVFIYFVKNIDFFKTNDNFIRLGLFIIFTMSFSILGSYIEMSNPFTFILMNSLYLSLTMILFFACRPFTSRDINFAKKLLPTRVHSLLRYYRPSKSIYDKTSIE